MLYSVQTVLTSYTLHAVQVQFVLRNYAVVYVIVKRQQLTHYSVLLQVLYSNASSVLESSAMVN